MHWKQFIWMSLCRPGNSVLAVWNQSLQNMQLTDLSNWGMFTCCNWCWTSTLLVLWVLYPSYSCWKDQGILPCLLYNLKGMILLNSRPGNILLSELPGPTCFVVFVSISLCIFCTVCFENAALNLLKVGNIVCYILHLYLTFECDRKVTNIYILCHAGWLMEWMDCTFFKRGIKSPFK